MTVLRHRYLRKNDKGEFAETPSDLFRRVAHAIAGAELNWGDMAEAEKWETEFFELMSSLKFLPNSPTLMNAGTRLNQLSACFVLPVPDSIVGIFTTLKNAALIQQSGGGTGFNFSQLRPKNDPVSITGGTASGPVSFMKIFDAATEYIRQGGKRRGANMGILNIDHPDIQEFIGSKMKEDDLRNFNISVGISDSFMQCLQSGADWTLIHPNSREPVKKLKAQKLWDAIVQNAWKSGDPGLVFLDTMQHSNPIPGLGKIEATNPCGEVPLLSYEACNLGSVNLSRFTKEGKGDPGIDWNKLEKAIHTSIRFLDNVIEVNNYLIPGIKSVVMGNRKIGLGVMGWADLLCLLGIPYDTNEAIELAERLMKFIRDKSMEASVELAARRGSFKNWEKSIFYPGNPVRNATRNSIAPTGTISIIAGCSSSIEPLFALAYSRKHVLDGEPLVSLNRILVEHLKNHRLYSDERMERILATGSIQDENDVPETTRNIFKTAMEISPEWHLRHQAAFQRFTDNAVSKTINLPESATRKEIDRIYRSAWQDKLKGITVFRYHSKKKQVLEKGIRLNVKGCKICIE